MKKLTSTLFSFEHKRLPVDAAGLHFKNPVGLAAGFDKDARLVDELACFGFGYIEIGTLTPRPQPGNPRPRLFRLRKDKALVNRMGFNNGGAALAARRLQRRKSNVVVGANIGKNKNTPNEDALSDYLYCFHALADVVDYFTINVSSPNTPGLRELQQKEPLMRILHGIVEANNSRTVPRPVFLKISPDLNEAQLVEIAEIINNSGIDGIIATNTTIARDGLLSNPATVSRAGDGGLSGTPLQRRSDEVISLLKKHLLPGKVIIGVGGIMGGEDSVKKMRAGAQLLQIYTGFVYEGAMVVRRILKTLAAGPGY